MNQDGDNVSAGSASRWNLQERGHVIRKKRKEVGISQSRLAKLAGVCLTAITNLETGVSDVKPSTFAKVEEALTDAMAGVRMTRMLRSQRLQVGKMSQLVPPKNGTEECDSTRHQFAQQGIQSTTEFVLQITSLQQQIADYRRITDLLQRQADNWHEAATLQSEVISQYERQLGADAEKTALVQRSRQIAGVKE